MSQLATAYTVLGRVSADSEEAATSVRHGVELPQREIAAELYVALNTVKSHRRAIFRSSASPTASQRFTQVATAACSDEASGLGRAIALHAGRPSDAQALIRSCTLSEGAHADVRVHLSPSRP